MQGEREVLRRAVFPIVREACEQRGIAFFEIDLRWGVTRAESEGGRVLSICLEEIDRCRPFLLGMIGGRYGWIDPAAAARLAFNDRFAALREHAARSVTELELRYALLNLPPGAPAPMTLLYRRPGAPLPGSGGSIAASGESFSPLMRELDERGFAVRDSPDSLEEFADRVRADLLAVVEALPSPSKDDPAARAREQSRRTAELMAYRFVPPENFEELLRLIAHGGERIILAGPAGSGKTMLAAALARACASPENQVFAALRPGGWSEAADAWREIEAQIGVPPGNPNSGTRASVQAALAGRAELGPVIAIVDGVEDRNLSGAAIPAWLPERIAGVTQVATFRADPDMIASLRREGWRVIALEPISHRRALAMAELFLVQFGRKLDDGQVEALRRAPRTAMELAIILGELRTVARFEDLDAAVAEFAAAADLAELISIVIGRLQREHGAAAEVALSCLALAPEGLPESVLRSLAGSPDEPLPQLRFSLLRHDLQAVAGGDATRLNLRSSALADEILAKLHPAGSKALRRQIVERLTSDPELPGAAEEVLRQLVHLREWTSIESFLRDERVFDALTRRAGQQLRAYWTRLREQRPSAASSAYAGWIGVAPPGRVARAARLMQDIGDSETARRLAEDGLGRAGREDPFSIASCAAVLAALAEARGAFGLAAHYLEVIAAADISAEVAHASAVAALRLARIELLRRGPAASRAALASAAVAVANAHDRRLDAVLMEAKAASALESGETKPATSIYRELVATGDRLGDLAIVAAGEAGLAKALRLSGKAPAAKAAAARATRLARIVGDDRVLQDVLGTSAKIAIEAGEFDDAYALVGRRRELTKAIGDIVGELEAEIDRARICARLGETDEAKTIAAGVRARANKLGLSVIAARAEFDSKPYR